VDSGDSDDDDNDVDNVESVVERSGKLEVLAKILPLWKKQGHRVLIFCQWTKMLNIFKMGEKSEKFRATNRAADILGDTVESRIYYITGANKEAGNAINQIAEKDTDAMMKRTASRPLPSGRMTVDEASTFAVVAAVFGIFIIGLWFNWTAAGISGFSLFLYGFIYTPLKKVHSIAVLVGAIPGALPCLIGWAAGDPELGIGGWILFSLQFFWQFPHFWAIAWVAHEDYSKAGFRLLPSRGGPTKYAAVQAILYSVLLIPIGVLPFVFGMTGMVSVVIVALANLAMLWQAIQLFNNMDVASARKVMFGSYIYLPVVLLALLADKMN
jgi:protoheme IX farnesyltransferase